MTKHNFCTIFDKNYLTRGLVLYFSLERNCGDFRLWVLCLDGETYTLLEKINLKKIHLIKLEEFENDKLLAVKKERTRAEYAWTCSSYFCFYILEKEKLGSVTYLDADLFFFSNPEPILNEINDASVAIIEHRFLSKRKYFEKITGRFNVEWVTFRNNEDGKKALKWWTDRVIEWCYDRYEDGKFGDQLYLNKFPELFKGVHIIKHKGAGVAPWNVAGYKIQKRENKLLVDGEELIFYHFHKFKMLNEKKYVKAIGYHILKEIDRLIYQPYFNELSETLNFIRQFDNTFNYGFTDVPLYFLFLDKIMENKLVGKLIEWFIIFKHKFLWHSKHKL